MTSWTDRARHCPLCGARLELREVEGRKRPACPDCSYVLYRNPASASGALVVREREILLVRRGIDPYKDCWGIPAGFQEYEEDPETTAIRETLEETGIRIRILGLLSLLYTVDDPRKKANLAVFLGVPVEGTLRPGADASEVRWWSLDRLPDRIAFRNNRKLCEELLRSCPAGPILASLQAEDGSPRFPPPFSDQEGTR